MTKSEEYFDTMYKRDGVRKFVEQIMKLTEYTPETTRREGFPAIVKTVIYTNGLDPNIFSEDMPKVDYSKIRNDIAWTFGIDPASIYHAFEDTPQISGVVRNVITGKALGTKLEMDPIMLVEYCKSNSLHEETVICYLIGVLLGNRYREGTRSNDHFDDMESTASYIYALCIRLAKRGYVMNFWKRPIWEILEMSNKFTEIGKMYIYSQLPGDVIR